MKNLIYESTESPTSASISPICNSSIEAVKAVLEPTYNDYYYFVADKNKKIYYSKTEKEHNNTINTLKEKDLWYEY